MKYTHLLTSLLSLASIGIPLSLKADLKIEVYGYAKLDVQYNDRNTGSFPSPAPTSVPLNSDKRDLHSELIIDARESRIGIKATDEVKNVKMTGVVEGDFFTASGDAVTNNSRGFRLRMAFGRADFCQGFFILAGQNWSTFMNDTIAQPLLIDFNGPVGSISARQPQLRIGYQTNNTGALGNLLIQAAVEKQAMSTLGEFNPLTVGDPAQGAGFRLPLFVAKLSWLMKHFQIEAAGAGAQNIVVVDDQGNQSKQGVWGAQSSAQVNYKDFTLFGSISHLSGLNRLDGGNYVDCVLNLSRNLVPVKSNGWYLGGSWNFNTRTSFNTVFGWNNATEIPGTAFSGLTYRKFLSFHANVMHQFWERWQTGLEYQRFDVKAFTGEPGHVDILHTAFYYFF